MNHFDFFDVRGTSYDDTVYQQLIAAKLTASERANQVAAEAAPLGNDKGTDDRRPPSRPQRLRKAPRK